MSRYTRTRAELVHALLDRLGDVAKRLGGAQGNSRGSQARVFVAPRGWRELEP